MLIDFCYNMLPDFVCLWYLSYGLHIILAIIADLVFILVYVSQLDLCIF